MVNVASLGAISSLESVSRYQNTQSVQENAEQSGKTRDTFDSILNSALGMLQETEDYSNAAEVEEIKFASGQSDSMHDLMIAQQKANISLQYTVAVKNAAVDAYRTIMNMQF